MRHITFLLVLLSCSVAFTPQAQEDKTPKGVKPKNAVEKMIAKAKDKGEEVLVGCLHDCEQSGDNITQGILNGHAISLPKPEYPPSARAVYAEGAVEVQVLIDYNGKVIAAAVLSGHPLLQSTSLQAARYALFKPTKIEGQPVKVTGILRYTFSRTQ